MRVKFFPKSCLAAALAVVLLAQPTSAASWVHDSTGWWWQEDNGSYPTNSWKKINGKWFWFDKNGYIVSGWQKINGKWYWFDKNGHMASGWQKINSKWYFLDKSGAMVSSKWVGNYYLQADGSMAVNRWIGNYYVNESGQWTKTKVTQKWILDGNRWWYRHSDGSYAKNGWETIDGKDYLFDASGWMLTGWQKFDEKWYFLERSGAKAVNKWIDQYYVDESGVWTKTKNQHEWQDFHWDNEKFGYACNYCCKDLTGLDYDGLYGCHGGFHTHTFYLFPSYYSCTSCDKLLHVHHWNYQKPDFQEGSNEILHKGYWKCWECGNQSSDGKNADPIPISAEGYEYSSHSRWETPFNFQKDTSHSWIIQDGSWEPADDTLYLQNITLSKSIYSMSVGDSYQYTVTFTPANPSEGKQVSWESSDPSVVSVDNSGKIIALKNGEATITATASTGLKRTSFVRVTDQDVGNVTSAALYINGQSSPDQALHIKQGTYNMNLKTTPENAVYEVRYEIEENSSTNLIALITGSCLLGDVSIYSWEHGIDYTDSSTTIEFLNPGTVTITATISDVLENYKFKTSQTVIVE